MPFYYYYDPTYSLVLIGLLLCLAASARVRSTYAKYGRVRSRSGLTGREAAEQILRSAGIYDVRIEHVSGNLTDHFDPRKQGTASVRCHVSVCFCSGGWSGGPRVRTRDPAFTGICAVENQKRYRSGGEFWICHRMAIDPSGTVIQQPFFVSADPDRDSGIFVCRFVSACYPSGGVQRIEKGSADSGRERDAASG